MLTCSHVGQSWASFRWLINKKHHRAWWKSTLIITLKEGEKMTLKTKMYFPQVANGLIHKHVDQQFKNTIWHSSEFKRQGKKTEQRKQLFNNAMVFVSLIQCICGLIYFSDHRRNVHEHVLVRLVQHNDGYSYPLVWKHMTLWAVGDHSRTEK